MRKYQKTVPSNVLGTQLRMGNTFVAVKIFFLVTFNNSSIGKERVDSCKNYFCQGYVIEGQWVKGTKQNGSITGQ